MLRDPKVMLSVLRLALDHCGYEATQYGHQGSRKTQLELREEIHNLGHRKKAAGVDTVRAYVAIADRAAAAAGRVVAYAQTGCRVAAYTEELSAGTPAVTLIADRAAEAASPLAPEALTAFTTHIATTGTAPHGKKNRAQP
jgi:hypothetical protein